MATTTAPSGPGGPSGAPAAGGAVPGLRRSIGFWGLMFVSLGSIIGSGWLLGALNAAEAAGPASLVSWVLAAGMLIVLALVHAELGAAYPVSGGSARYPYFAFGTLAGFTAGWASWLQAVTIAPIEVEASITYLDSVKSISDRFTLIHTDGTLTTAGLVLAVIAMAAFTVINLAGAKLLSDSNSAAVIWKTAVPLLTIVVLLTLVFRPGNFSAGGGFAPFGAHGVFAALPAGVVFALQGFEQAVQLAGEAKDPQRDVSRAVITAMLIGAGLYILLEVVFIGALDPANLASGWSKPIGSGDYGVYYTLALGAGAGWLAIILIIDAVISPAGTGLVYVGTSARLSYALGEDPVLPRWLTRTSGRGVPVGSVLLAFVIGLISFLPFPSWNSLVGLVTSATAIMYAFAPVSLAALQSRDPGRPRPYRLPCPRVLAPVAFCSADLIIYWSGFEATWKILTGLFIGRVLFELALRRMDESRRRDIDWRAAAWIWPWLIGMTILGLMGRYGDGSQKIFPEWVDLVVVIAFSLVVFYWAVSLAMETAAVEELVEREEHAHHGLEELNVAG